MITSHLLVFFSGTTVKTRKQSQRWIVLCGSFHASAHAWDGLHAWHYDPYTAVENDRSKLAATIIFAGIHASLQWTCDGKRDFDQPMHAVCDDPLLASPGGRYDCVASRPSALASLTDANSAKKRMRSCLMDPP
jgi:hypothetical protein